MPGRTRKIKKGDRIGSSGTFRDEDGQVHIRVPSLGPGGPDVYARVKKGKTTFSTVTPEEKKPQPQEDKISKKPKGVGEGVTRLVDLE